MSYSINPNLPKARALALKLLINKGLPLQMVANKCGVHRSTIYRWKQKWLKLNEYVQLTNYDRPNRKAEVLGSVVAACNYWGILRKSYYYWYRRWVESGRLLVVSMIYPGLQSHILAM